MIFICIYREKELKSVRGDHPKYSSKINCVEMLRLASVEIKALNYKASKIACVRGPDGKTTGGAVKELRVGLMQEIDSISEEMIYIKAKVAGLKDPLKFSITWASNVPPKVRADLKIFLSMEHKEPN
jgi:hypothetical protein